MSIPPESIEAEVVRLLQAERPFAWRRERGPRLIAQIGLALVVFASLVGGAIIYGVPWLDDVSRAVGKPVAGDADVRCLRVRPLVACEITATAEGRSRTWSMLTVGDPELGASDSVWDGPGGLTTAGAVANLERRGWLLLVLVEGHASLLAALVIPAWRIGRRWRHIADFARYGQPIFVRIEGYEDHSGSRVYRSYRVSHDEGVRARTRTQAFTPIHRSGASRFRTPWFLDASRTRALALLGRDGDVLLVDSDLSPLAPSADTVRQISAVRGELDLDPADDYAPPPSPLLVLELWQRLSPPRRSLAARGFSREWLIRHRRIPYTVLLVSALAVAGAACLGLCAGFAALAAQIVAARVPGAVHVLVASALAFLPAGILLTLPAMEAHDPAHEPAPALRARHRFHGWKARSATPSR